MLFFSELVQRQTQLSRMIHSLTSVHAHLDRTGFESIVCGVMLSPCNHTVWTPTCRAIMGKAVRGGLVGAWMDSPKTRINFIGTRGRPKNVGKKQNMAPMWKKSMKHVDLDEPTSFLDHVYLGCTQRVCKPNEITIEECRKMKESPISDGAAEKITWVRKNLTQKQ